MDDKRKWYGRSGALIGGIAAGILAIGAAFGVVAVTNSSSDTGELSPVMETASPDALDAPVLVIDEPSESPEATDTPDGANDQEAGDESPNPSSSPDDDDDSGEDEGEGDDD